MALTMWGQVIIQSATPGEDPVQVGTIWVDTSGTPTVKTCTSISPYTFASIGGGVTDGDKGDISVTGSGATWTIDNDVVTFAKMQNASAASRLVGRRSGSTGDFEELSLRDGLIIDSTNLQLGLNVIAGGRLTITSATPVTSSDVVAAGTLYYTPYVGDKVALYDGTNWRVFTFTERSLSLTLTSGKIYDVFLYDNAGTLTLELSAAWTNDTTRADALTLQDGVYVKSGATTRRHLGTIRASGTNTTEDSYTKRFVWNRYNRVYRPLRRLETTDSWTYTLTDFRQANASTANQLELVDGGSEEAIDILAWALNTNTSADIGTMVAIGEDSTTTKHASQITSRFNGAVANAPVTVMSRLVTIPPLGYHFYAWLEKSQASGTTTWYGDTLGSFTGIQSGIVATWKA